VRNCEKRFSQLFRWKNAFHSYSDGKTLVKNAKGNSIPVGVECFPEKRGEKPGCFHSKVSKLP